jgi:peptide/nickel transport system permease protein
LSGRYLLGRLGHALLVLFGVSLLAFLFVELAPGDYFLEMEVDPGISRELVEQLKARYGVDRPAHERYLSWVGSVLRGELGYSFKYGAPVAEVLGPRVLNTLLLAGTAALVSWALALPLGAVWAASRGRPADRAATAGTAVLASVPELVLVLGLLALAAQVDALPTGGMRSSGWEQLTTPGRVADVARHMLLPVAALVLGALPTLLRHVRSAVAEQLEQPWVLAVRGQGVPPGRLLFRLVLPAAANPLATLFGLTVAGLLSGSLIVEHVMGWPGLGPLLLEAILARDVHLVLAPVLATTMLLVLGNLLADVLLAVLDPRIRSGEPS